MRFVPPAYRTDITVAALAVAKGSLWYTKPDDAIADAKFYSRSRDAVIRVHDDAGNVIGTHEHAGDFKEW
jgi:hypothetical protein